MNKVDLDSGTTAPTYWPSEIFCLHELTGQGSCVQYESAEATTINSELYGWRGATLLAAPAATRKKQSQLRLYYLNRFH